MLLIAHRGNTNGPNTARENSPEYLREAQGAGYEIEVDVWFTSGWFLGHDAPEYPVDESIFKALDPNRAWYHAKNAEALYRLRKRTHVHSFWHQEDDYALTSQGVIWVHPKSSLLPKGSICVLPEIRKTNEGLSGCAGICSDFVEQYRHV